MTPEEIKRGRTLRSTDGGVASTYKTTAYYQCGSGKHVHYFPGDLEHSRCTREGCKRQGKIGEFIYYVKPKVFSHDPLIKK